MNNENEGIVMDKMLAPLFTNLVKSYVMKFGAKDVTANLEHLSMVTGKTDTTISVKCELHFRVPNKLYFKWIGEAVKNIFK